MIDGTKIISVCGDVCSECPGYIATINDDSDKLNKLAQLWYRFGFRNSILTSDEMRCLGRNKDKICSFDLINCEHIKNRNNCGECNYFPCEKIKFVLQKTEETKDLCKEKCTDSEFHEMNRAFFMKEQILTDINNQVFKSCYKKESCSIDDYSQIVKDISNFWGVTVL